MVIGGGLAGLAAACDLADRGVPVVLLEKRPYLGGRAFSFPDVESGGHVDNGQHIYLACCTAYTHFLRRLGVFERTTLQPRLRAVIVDGDSGRRGELSAAAWLPSPLHLLPSFIAYPHLSLGEKARAAAAIFSIMRTDRAKHREALEAESFHDWLVRHNQSERAITALWDLLTLPVFNDTVADVSAYMGLMFFQDGMLAGRHSADIGVSRVGLTELVGDAACSYLADRGGEALTGRNVTRIAVDEGRVTGIVTDGTFMPASAVVSAVPWDALARLLAQETGVDAAFSTPALEWAPIVNAHVWYNQPVIDEPFLAVLDSPLQWVFNRSHIEGRDGPGQHLCISISGAWEYAGMGRESLRTALLGEMARVFPAAAEAAVERFMVVRQVNATFRCTPGAQALRPGQRTPLAGLTLAGDWTQTGWPATMESAVRSGLLAAEAVVADRERFGTALGAP